MPSQFILPPNIGLDELTEEDIEEGLKSGKIQLNEAITQKLKHSLIICDEITGVVWA